MVKKQGVPRVAKVALIYNPKTTPYAGYLKSIEASASSIGVELTTRGVADATEIARNDRSDRFSTRTAGSLCSPDFFTAANDQN